MARPTDSTFIVLTLCLALALFFGVLLATTMGYMQIPLSDILHIVYGQLSGQAPTALGDPSYGYVVMDVRLPRVLTAALVGAGLAVSGVVYQGILLNPLADPYTLGISSGAAFGASLALLANLTMLSQFSTPLCAFLGAICTLGLVMRLSSFNGQISPQTLILSGVIVSAILSAGISFLKYLADEQVAVIIFWLMGSFSASGWQAVLTAGMVVSLGTLGCLFFSRDLNIISLGRRSSDALGVETIKVRALLLLLASFITAVCVAISGIIGFIGLIVPHLMRYLVGPDNRKLLPVSALAGALLLLGADTLTRAVLPVEIPIGVLTALIGGPFFCVIFRQKQKGRSYE
jgi:iron complex transport system permease protein